MLPLYVVACILYGAVCAAAQRNAAAEKVCQTFLVSPSTSPLLSVDRNLTIDEDAEFECELVLQDRHLPAQIRLTVHEGLYFLSMRHIHMGMDKHQEIMRHARVLREMLPRSKRFAIFVAQWASSAAVGAFSEALDCLDCAFAGSCTEYDTVSAAEEYDARRLHARLLGRAGRDRDALRQLASAGDRAAPDFGRSFAIKDAAARVPAEQRAEIELGLDSSEALYAAVLAGFTSEYTGFRPPPAGSWTPAVQQCLDSAAVAAALEAHTERREPLVVRSCGQAGSLGWRAEDWAPSALAARAGAERGEALSVPAAPGPPLFAGSSNGLKRSVQLSDFLSRLGQGGDPDGQHAEVLMLRGSALGPDAALSGVCGEVPLPAFLNSTAGRAAVAVGLSMGGATARSRLHAEALDSLFTAVHGEHRFTLFSPDAARDMRTMYPTFAVARNGVSFQFIPRGAHNYITDINNRHFSVLASAEVEASVPRATVVLEPGDVLFVPAGWFHEADAAAGGCGAHAAFSHQWAPPRWREAAAFESRVVGELTQRLAAADGVKSDL